MQEQARGKEWATLLFVDRKRWVTRGFRLLLKQGYAASRCDDFGEGGISTGRGVTSCLPRGDHEYRDFAHLNCLSIRKADGLQNGSGIVARLSC